jgi:hypothetical protein
LTSVIGGDGKGHQLLKRQVTLAVDLHQFGRDRAQSQTLPHHMRRDAETGCDFFRTEPAFIGEFLERLELVGRVHVFAGDVFVQTDLVGSLAISTMQRIGSVFLISLRFTRSSWASRLRSLMVTK